MALFGLGYKKKLEEVKRFLDEQEYEQAALAADEISVKRLKSAYELNLIGKAYKCNGDFLNAKDAFERSYEVRCARPVLIDIMDCCLEVMDLDSAEKYFDEYHKVAPEDKVTQYKYRYRIEKKKGRDRRLLITILEELKVLDYMEEYAYELAKQYHKAGMGEECMRECDDIILWFGFGPTVERAKTLLAYYKGEISLEDIKAAGAKYQTEVRRRSIEKNTEEGPQISVKQPEEPVVEPQTAETTVPEEEPLTEEPQEEEWQEEWQEEWREEAAGFGENPQQAEVMEEQEPQTEEEVWEEEPQHTEVFIEEPQPEAEVSRSDGKEEFELPEIDLSGISFAEEPAAQTTKEEVYQENSRAEEELYVPAEYDIETANERLAELLKVRKISITEILKNFGRIERIRKQVIKSLELAINDREKAYFVVTGEPLTGKTTFALAMIRLLYEMDIVKYDRTATIDAVQLNQVSIEDYGEELKNCNLIIENAGGMTKESIEGLLRFSKGSKGKTCVILEDTVRDINKFLRAREEMNSLFNNRIHLGKYNAEDLFGFAYDYIKKEDYGIDKMAAKVLRDKLDEIVRDYSNDQRMIYTLKLVESVVARAEKRTGELILSMAAEGKIKQGDYLVIILDDVIE